MRKKLKTIGFLICFIAFTVNSAIAMELQQFRQAQEDSPQKLVYDSWIEGVGVGIDWANAEMILRKMKPLYCPSKNLTLGLENYLDILERQLQKIKEFSKKNPGTVKDINKFPVEYLLLQGLINTFPCDEK